MNCSKNLKISCDKCSKDNKIKRILYRPKDYQIIVKNDFFKSKDRGLLMYWGLGSGKTCGAIKIIDEYLFKYPNRKVYFISKASIRSNFFKEYCSLCGKNIDKFNSNVKCIHLNNPNLINFIKDINFDKSLIVVDEAHNFINSRKNNSKNGTNLYKKIETSQDYKILLLSGTPLLSNLDELYYLFKILSNKDQSIFHIWTLKEFRNNINNLIPWI